MASGTGCSSGEEHVEECGLALSYLLARSRTDVMLTAALWVTPARTHALCVRGGVRGKGPEELDKGGRRETWWRGCACRRCVWVQHLDTSGAGGLSKMKPT